MEIKTTIEHLLTTKQVSEITGYSISTLAQWRVFGVVGGPPFFKPKGRSAHVRYRASQIEAWIKKGMTTPISMDD
jgi:predicted DNA-binding transcriptional regulator AlpA